MKIRTLATAAAVVLGGLLVPALPAHASDVTVGPVSVAEYDCDPTVTSKCQPVDCSGQALGQPCRRACVDDACVYQTPGGFRAELPGACVFFGSDEQACANGTDGCALNLWDGGVRVGMPCGS